LYVDFLDTSGTLLALVIAMGIADEHGDFPRSRQAFAADALATITGSFFGLSPVTSYIESAAGVEAGSRTGLTAVFCGIFFLLSIFFAPIIASIPAWATGGALVIVGCLMAGSLKNIKWHDPAHAATAFLTVIIMRKSCSVPAHLYLCYTHIPIVGAFSCFESVCVYLIFLFASFFKFLHSFDLFHRLRFVGRYCLLDLFAIRLQVVVIGGH
jgi:xanthine/uracil/vitamin C permease (AzgA family)